MQRAAEEVGIAAFDAICSAQKDRRLGASDLTLPYPTLPYLRKVRTRAQFGVAAILLASWPLLTTHKVLQVWELVRAWPRAAIGGHE